MESVLNTFEEQQGEPIPEPARSRFLARDAEALVASMIQSTDTIGLEHGLSSVSTPVLAYAGTEDSMYEPAARAAHEIPSATFISLEGLDHMQGFVRTDLVWPHVTEFLASIESKDTPV
ncbi:MAG: hypothetical protein QF554_10310 [Dehalococcoidia bacterium]|nr:hypothetical protein [Dehalococcoidia bacterium]